MTKYAKGCQTIVKVQMTLSTNFVNKVLREHYDTHLVTHYLWLLSGCLAEYCDRDYMYPQNLKHSIK